MTTDAERFSIASRLYVRLRRLGGPTIDAMKMLNDDDYARATVQHLAAIATDEEVVRMAARLDALLNDMRLADQPVRQTAPLPQRTQATIEPAAAPAANRYVGALR